MVSVSKTKVIQRLVIAQKDAELEMRHISELINGYFERNKQADRAIVNYLKLDTIINYLSTHKLHSVKAKSLEK
jgi:hypothetical protein